MRITAEPGSECPCVASPFKAVAEFAPALVTDAAEVTCGGWVSPRRNGGDQTYFAAQHDRW